MISSRAQLVIIVAVLVVMAAGVARLVVVSQSQPRQGGWDQRPLEGLGTFGAVPEFSLVERSGRHVKLSDFQGKIWLANFIYTNCKDSCPLQSAEIAKLQNEMENRSGFEFVSISVDPEHDTPEVLSRYAERFKADPQRWLFLTGDKSEIYRLAQEGFRLSAVPASEKEAQETDVILHSSRFVLVDGKGQIRGYYDSTDAEAVKRLRHDIRVLLSTG
jgi:protein SCO1/2